MSREKRGSRRALLLIVVIIAFICVLMWVRTDTLSKELEAKEAKLAELNTRIADAESETAVIEEEIRYRETDDYIEDQARESLGLRYPDEIILVPGNGDDKQ